MGGISSRAMDFSRLDQRRTIIGGMAAILLLIVSLFFLPWFSLDRHSRARRAGTRGSAATATSAAPASRPSRSCAGCCSLLAARAADPRLDRRQRPQALVGAGRDDDGRRLHRDGPDRSTTASSTSPAPATARVRDQRSTTATGSRCSRRSVIAASAFMQIRSTEQAAARTAQGARHRLSRRALDWPTTPASVISHDVRSGDKPDRNLALELVRVTEAAALAAARWVGRGEKEAADQAAVDAMRLMLDTVPMDGIVVIGEGEKDEAPMLYNGEQIGDGSPPEVDIAVDPLEGTRLTARGMPAALSVIALAERGTMFDPGPCVYMEKIAGGPRDRRLPQPRRPARRRDRAASPSARAPSPATSRHHARPPAPRGGRRSRSARPARGIRFITDGDVSAALLAVTARHRRRPALGHRRHPRGRALGGRDQVPRRPASSAASGRATTTSARPPIDAGYDLDRVLDADDLVARRGRLLRRHRRHRRRSAAGRPLPRRRPRDHRVAGHALALGHRPQGPGPPRPAEAARGHRRPLRLSAARAPDRRRDRLHRRAARRRAVARRGVAVRALARDPVARRRPRASAAARSSRPTCCEPETLRAGARGRRGRLLPRPFDGPRRRDGDFADRDRDGGRKLRRRRREAPASSRSSTSAASARPGSKHLRSRHETAEVLRGVRPPGHLLPRRGGDRRRAASRFAPSSTSSSDCR